LAEFGENMRKIWKNMGGEKYGDTSHIFRSIRRISYGGKKVFSLAKSYPMKKDSI